MDSPNTPTNASSDVAIVRRVQEGDTQAYNLLVIKYQHKAKQIALKFVHDPADAVDIAQEAFLKAYRAIGGFRGESSFSTWLYRIVVNVAKTFLESNAKHRDVEDIDADDIDYKDNQGTLRNEETPDRIMESLELQNVILKVINELPPDQKQALIMREVEEMSYEDIALAMKIPAGTVRSRIFRARAYVEEQLQKYNQGLGESHD